MKRHLRLRCPLLKGQGAMPPPFNRSLAFLRKRGDAVGSYQIKTMVD